MSTAETMRATPTLPPGVLLRPYRGPDADLPGMWAANDAARRFDGELEPISLEGMRASYEHLERCDPERDLRIVEVDGEIAGYVRVLWADTNEGERWYEAVCLLRPEARRRGIGTAMLAWTETRRREIDAELTAAAGPLDRPRFLMSHGFDGDPGASALLRASGYEPFRHFFSMRRPDLEAIPEAALPDGLEIRPIPAERDALWTVFQADSEAFRDHYGTLDDSEEDFLAWIEDPETDPSLWFVAFDGDEVAGGVLAAVHDGAEAGTRDGWLDSIFTRRPWRRRGLARALIVRALAALRERGITNANLGVDADNANRALDLYRSCGFEVRSSTTAWRKPLDQEETDR